MNNTYPTLSVGMPAYNSEKDIRLAVDSILNQSFKDFELIISDNASNDLTQTICEEYVQKDKRVRYIRNDINIGASENYNNVFRKAKGKYFKWASSNDYCAPGFFEQCVRTLEENPRAAVVCPQTRLFSKTIDNCIDYTEHLHTTADSPTERMLYIVDNMRLNNVMNGVIRSNILAQTPLMIPFCASDCCLMGELALHGDFIELPDYLFYRQMDEESSTSMQDDDKLLEHYDPISKKPMRFQNWKIHGFYFAAVKRADLPTKEAIYAYKELSRRMVWFKDRLLRDFLFWKPFRTKSITNWKAL